MNTREHDTMKLRGSAIWQDEAGSTWLGFPRMERLAADYGLQDHPAIPKLQRLLEELVRRAGGVY